MAYVFVFIFNTIGSLLFPSIFIFISAIITLAFWKKIFSKILLGIAIVYFYFSANGALPHALISYLEQPFDKIDNQEILSHRAMIVLGGGISHYPKQVTPGILSYSRALEAYRIYKFAQDHGIQYTIFLSGGDVQHKKISEASLYRKTLQQLGVPSQQIITEDKSLNTYQNAENLTSLLKNRPWQSYMLVTSELHMRRATLYFKQFGVKTIAAPSDYPYPIITILPTEYNLIIQALVLKEYMGIIRLKLYNFLGLNAKHLANIHHQ